MKKILKLCGCSIVSIISLTNDSFSLKIPSLGGVMSGVKNLGNAAQAAKSAVSDTGALVGEIAAVVPGGQKVAQKIGDVTNKATQALSGDVGNIAGGVPGGDTAQRLLQKAGTAAESVQNIAGVFGFGPAAQANTKGENAAEQAGGGALQKLLQAQKKMKESTQAQTEEPSVTENIEEPVSQETIAKVDVIFERPCQFVNAANLGLNDSDIGYFCRKLVDVGRQLGGRLVLDLSDNQLTPVGLRKIFETLKENPKLIVMLSLSGNNFGQDGAVVIAEHIRFAPFMTRLHLARTSMDGEGLVIILKSLADFGNTSLSSIDFSGNPVTAGDIQSIANETKFLNADVLREKVILSGGQIPQGTEMPMQLKIRQA
jgi:hypothetical protein